MVGRCRRPGRYCAPATRTSTDWSRPCSEPAGSSRRHRPTYGPSVLAEPAEIRLHDTLGKTRAARLGLLAAIAELGEQTLAWEHLHT